MACSQRLRICLEMSDFYAVRLFHAGGERASEIFSALFYSFGLSLCVETFQLLAKVGSFDVDDLLLNTIGGIAGYIMYVICNAIRRKYVYKQEKKDGRG